MAWPRQRARKTAGQRGSALLIVTFLLIIILVGGLAAVAVTSGELSSSRGYRTRQITRTCAEAGLEHARAIVGTHTQIHGTLEDVWYRTGHYYDEGVQDTFMPLEAGSFDAAALSEGENITNVLVGGSGSGVQVLSATTVCSGDGHGAREMQLIFMYGNPMGDR